MWLLQVARHQCIVSAVSFPGNVEHIAEQRDRANHDIDAQIDDHARQRNIWNTAKPRSHDKDARCKSCDHIADPGQKADDAVQSKANGCAGNKKPVVEKMRQPVKILIGEEAAAPPRTRRKALGDWRKDIWLHDGLCGSMDSMLPLKEPAYSIV